jgi:hypothetical protein
MRVAQTVAGMTGHRDLRDPATSRWVSEMIGLELERQGASSGVCCLAVGADQVFAEEVLNRRLELRAILPSRRYEETFESAEERAGYRKLLARASRVITLPYDDNSDEAFLAGGKAVVDASAVLIAVWDRQPAAGLGGTADIVEYARRAKRPIVHINPTHRTVKSLE